MNTSDTIHEDEIVENNPERTDGGYEQSDDVVGNPVIRRLRSTGILPASTVGDQHISETDADKSMPAIVRWHDLIRRGR